MASVLDAANEVQAAIDFGRLAAQRAPAGHPIFDALTAAEAHLASIKDRIPFWSLDGGEASYAVVDEARFAIDRIYDAAADIRNDPDAPLAKTTYEQVKALPWGWIGAGVAGVLGAAIYFHRQSRGGRRR